MTKKADFKYRVSQISGAEDLLNCYACGTCTAGCPVRALDPRYNPRRIIRRVLLGDEDILAGEEIWLCTSCYTCQERCPQNVRITDLINALRNMAVEAGYSPPGIAMQSKFVADFGRLYELSEFDNKKREKMGLPPVQISFAEIAALFPETAHTGDEPEKDKEKTNEAE